MESTTPDRAAVQQSLERFLACPTAENLAALQSSAQVYQTRWISEHAGTAAASTWRPAIKDAPKLAYGDRTILQRIADGWQATPADVPRWSWYEDRDLLRVAPHPEIADAEILVLTDLAHAALAK